MKFVKEIDGNVHIYVEPHEDETKAIICILQASFDLARYSNEPMSEQAKRDMNEVFFKLTSIETSVLKMDCVDGHQCNTHIKKIADKHLSIDIPIFEKNRKDISAVLGRAQDLVAPHKFKGEELDKIPAEYGFKRNPDESGWDFRRRIFADFYLKSRSVKAFEFLVGVKVDDFGDVEKLAFIMLIGGNQDRATLNKFAYDFNIDPLELREMRAAGEDV